jgi:GPI mannosyltransferase 1 subunit M
MWITEYSRMQHALFATLRRITRREESWARSSRLESTLFAHLRVQGLTTCSPYTRSTYRYTPLLAFILTPNELLHPTFGKLLFSIADILIGILIKQILASSSSKINPNPDTTAPKEPGRSTGLTRDEIILATIWLLNPLPANISTRGSAESFLGLMVIATLYAAIKRNWDLCAVLLGLSVHWKIYPIIYAGSLLPFIGSVPEGIHPSGFNGTRSWTYYGLKWIGNRQRLRFGLIMAISFTGLSAAMYLLYVFTILALLPADVRFFD